MMMRILVRDGVLAALILAALATPAAAQGRGRGQGSQQAEAQKEKAEDQKEERVFKDDDLDVFRNYARRNNIVADALPPGIAKNLERGKPLPPGIAKRDLPPGLGLLMPKVGRGTSFSIFGDKIVAERDGKVVDIIDGVFKK